MKTGTLLVMISLLICANLSACGPSQAEMNATVTQGAANIFATLTAQAPTATPTFTPSPTSTATPISTSTPTPVLFLGPVSKYLPSADELPANFKVDDGTFVQQLRQSLNGLINNWNAIRFVNTGKGSAFGPQDGTPDLILYWIDILESKSKAIEYYNKFNSAERKKGMISLAMPFESDMSTVGSVLEIDTPRSNCDEWHIYKATSSLGIFGPSVGTYSGCRIGNIVIFIFSYIAEDNYDGKGQHIPDENLAQIAESYLSVVLEKL
jgi:hypothetical protein